ncbi:MAG TPA: ATP-binding protein [Bacteroidales bacterium]|nr:ATP-binding protein [Bacteroidales bacterium]
MKTLALNILDIVQNSLRAGAKTIRISVQESEITDRYSIEIEDDGKGIPAEILKKVTDPFITTRTKRRMGMGLALLKHHAELTGGYLEVESKEGTGTIVRASFCNSHFDRQPLGDIGGIMKILIGANPSLEFIYNHSTDKGSYSFSTAETKNYLEITQITDYELLEDIRSMINENLAEIKASGLELKAGA